MERIIFEFWLRTVGSTLGVLTAHWLVKRILLTSTGGEGTIADGLWFWLGGWVVVLFYYAAGFIIGLLGTVPLVNAILGLCHLDYD